MMSKLKSSWSHLSVFARTTLIGTILVGLLTGFLSDGIRNLFKPDGAPEAVGDKPHGFRQAFVINCADGVFRAAMTVGITTPGTEPPGPDELKELVEQARNEDRTGSADGESMTRSEVIDAFRRSLAGTFGSHGLHIALLEIEDANGQFERIDLPPPNKNPDARNGDHPAVDPSTVVPSAEPSPVTVTPPMDAPTISPPSGAYASGGLAVTLSTIHGDATIHFTTDGSDPSADSPVYGSPLTITAPATLKAIARRSDGTTSPVGSATYTVATTPPGQPPAPAPPSAPTGLRVTQ